MLANICENLQHLAVSMAQWLKMFVMKHDDLSLIPRTNMMEGGNQLLPSTQTHILLLAHTVQKK